MQRPSRGYSPIFRLLLIFIILFACHGGIETSLLHGQAPKPIREDGTLEFLAPNGEATVAITIEIADTLMARARGLMGKRTLDDTMGMLFVYKSAGNRVFWMRNTVMSLDILFISETNRVINIARQTQPISDTRYHSKAPAKFVVEVISGFCDRHGIKKGTQVRWVRR